MSKQDIAVAVFGVNVSKRLTANAIGTLRHERTEPHEIALLDGQPLLFHDVHAFTSQDVSTMFLYMRFNKGMAAAWLEGKDVHVHIKAKVIRRQEVFDADIIHALIDGIFHLVDIARDNMGLCAGERNVFLLVKQELRGCSATNIMYSTRKPAE